MTTREEALQAQEAAKIWLADNLKLQIHPKNSIVIKAASGLKFLGHQIYPTSNVSVDKYMLSKIPKAINTTNVASYINSHLPKRYARRLPWVLKDKI